ncbi:uncharacterized protein BDR25DRAFT_365209 [Lindgomyces ingoldianus]|uniref:Uncharacterized protein n=1 Tax=Lindgomyces ingoldianus TaxID=673940 RepID=A0ACB6RI36_9PLEO|nr:uncharacterized protein BDR25DRAFT_365209 [Lindgomyces ingoldianus]KAF2478131.1 hypothetical protein BDR25DRAFT_365209 [Lindgomyces ingoldianus]
MRYILPLISTLVPALLAAPTSEYHSRAATRELENLLLPNENGELVYATAAQLAARNNYLDTHSMLGKRDGCSEDFFDGKGNDGGTCFQYCERATSTFLGAPVKVSADINCDVATCGIAHSDAVTITEGFSITLGANSPAGEEGAGVLTASASFSWSRAETTSNTYTFNPTIGDVGYLVFRPRFKQSCGIYQVWTYYQTDDGFTSGCIDPIFYQDNNACGNSPMKLGSGFADGEFTFCRTTTGQGC